MVKLEIINKKEGLYYLKDSKNNNYEFSMEFYDIDESPKIGDCLELSSELLNPMYAGYSTLYAFGNLENPCGRSTINMNSIDIIKLIVENKEIILKRLYG